MAEKFIITGRSRLDGNRVQISRPMTHEEALARLDREVQNRKRQKYPAYTRLKVERLEAVQLCLNFDQD